jgi:hypothetical protein
MSRLYFAPIAEAFYLGSDQIKDTQAEIAKLKTIIGDSALVKKSSLNVSKQENDQRVGQSDKVVATFNPQQTKNESLNQMDLMKIVQHPKFEDIVKSYIIVQHPEWINSSLNNTMYIPNTIPNPQNFQKSSFTNNGFNGFTKERFGEVYSTTVSSNIKNYLFFFIAGMVVYLLLEKYIKK